MSIETVFITGGAGYVGSALIPRLLNEGYKVKNIDLYIYGDDVLSEVQGHPNLEEIKGDIRDVELLDKHLAGCDAVIHLACISNDPSYELNPALGKSINYDAFFELVKIAKAHRIARFIYASSSSVYGIKDELNVTEDLELEPLTDYSKYKAMCEDVLMEAREPGFTTVIVRPATVCGYAPRLRLDVVVNILTNLAINNRRITVFGGDQRRPNVHIKDMVDFYVQVLRLPAEQVDGGIYNLGTQNYKVKDLADIVRNVVGDDVEVVTAPTDDKRSYHISSEKAKRELGFEPQFTVEDAVRDLKEAFDAGKIPNSLTDKRYFNVKLMQDIDLK